MVQYYSESTRLANNKNIIINGNMIFFQRGTSAITTSGSYLADRWRMTFSSSGACSVERSTDVPSSGVSADYSLKATVTTADTSVDEGDWMIPFHYSVEGYDFRRFVGKNGTLSFWIKSNLTGTYSISVRNSGSDRSYVLDYTINQANTWEKKVLTFPFDYTGGTWDYENGIGLNIYWAAMIGSSRQGTPGSWIEGNALGSVNQINWAGTINNNLYLSQVQFEVGNIATNFEERLTPYELRLCQRYYEKSVEHSVILGSGTVGCNVILIPAEDSNVRVMGIQKIPFVIEKAVTPTVTVFDRNGTASRMNKYNSAATIETVSSVVATSKNIAFTRLETTAFTAGYFFECNWAADGELV